jgi:hypothetical protein
MKWNLPEDFELACGALHDVNRDRMKPNPWIIPALALLVVGIWIATRKQSSATLEREIEVIRERIQQAKDGAADEESSREATDKAGKEKEKSIDWKDLASKVTYGQGRDMQDMRAMMRMQRLLMDLSADELCVEIDEIAALDLEDNVRKQLQGMILGVLAEKDPKLALEKFSDQLGDQESGLHWQLSSALKKWAEKDPVGAVTWLDQQIASGKLEGKSLDGRNRSLTQFEGSIMGPLLDSDPALATARIKALPESQRVDLLQQGSWVHITEKNEGSYAKLVRDSLESEKVGHVLANTAGNLARQGGFERVDGFIANSHATDEEKKLIVTEAFENKINPANMTMEELEKARVWAAKQSPGVVDKATGEAIASSLWRGGDFQKASELALKYQASTGSDEVLAAFLKSPEVQHKSAEEARSLIDNIKDPALQEEIRNLPQYQKNKSGQ